MAQALSQLEATPGISVQKVSRFVNTKPLGPVKQPDFLNAVVRIKTGLGPIALLDALLAIEQRLGRIRRKRWGPRTIDLDILYYGERTLDHPRLRVPHPEIQNRPFVLEGLREAGFLKTMKNKKMKPLPDSKVTAPALSAMKKAGQKIVTLTCYDYAMAQLLNASGIDVLLVGDSLGMVKLGYASTLPVTVEDIEYHTRIVARGNSRALLVADMPYLSYQASKEDAVRHGGRMLKAGAEAIKIEGGEEMLPMIKALQSAKIPVMGHLGMTPQSVHVFGGYKVQGRQRAQRQKLLSDARKLEQAGVFAIVLECVPEALAKQISRRLRIPTIGIGAGLYCDGQVLVIDDLLGLTAPPLPRFVKTYLQGRPLFEEAIRRYAKEVRTGLYPDETHSYL
jgi:3-methyl-2-oxobutanoate hydroxymethyltransferase